MRKSYKWAVVIAVIVVLWCGLAMAETDGDWTYTINNGEAEVTGYIGNETELRIPAMLGSYHVTSIGFKAFYGLSSLTSITIPDSITRIKDYAFGKCSGLMSIEIPDSVITIGEYAFFQCSSLMSITIPDSIDGIDRYVFSGCSGLKSIIFAEGIEYLSHFAFLGCSGLESITIPDSVSFIGDSVFEGCSSLTSITIPESLTSIGHRAFYGCDSLMSITIPDTVNSIGQWAFYGCSSLTSITIPDSVKIIRYQTFSNCNNLKQISIPDGVTSIEDYAFDKCTNLMSVTIPNTVTSIGDTAFSSCESLTSITIPESVNSIGNYAFSSCRRLKSITIPAGVTSIGDFAFWPCDSLSKAAICGVNVTLGDFIFPNTTTIYCYSSSDVDFWASGRYPVVYLDEVVIYDEIREVTLMPDFYRLSIGSTFALGYNVFPNDDHPNLIWTVDDPNVASVTENGILIVLSAGETTITLSVGSASDSISVHAYVAAESFDLPDEIWVISKDILEIPVLNIMPAEAEAIFMWSSADEGYAVVDENGTVTGKKIGQTTITAVSDTGISRTCTVHICRQPSSVTLAPAEMTLAAMKRQQLIATVTAGTETLINHFVAFTSSDPAVVTVNENGVVTAVSIGQAAITATAGDYSATCMITVTAPKIFTLPTSLTVIETEAFTNMPKMDAIRIPSSVISIDANSFDPGMILIVPSGSKWVQWAELNGYKAVEE